MKYEFEIRGEFEAEAPPIALNWFSIMVDEVDGVISGKDIRGKVTGHQLALKGKLQEPKKRDVRVNVADVSTQGDTLTVVLEVHDDLP